MFKQFLFIFLSISFMYCSAIAQQDFRWQMDDDKGIYWNTKAADSHLDHVEMSGFEISSILYYGVQEGELQLSAKLVFPGLRTIPNDTHASLIHPVNLYAFPLISLDGEVLKEFPYRFEFDGTLMVKSKTTGGLNIDHQLFPSIDEPAFIDKIRIENSTDEILTFEIGALDSLFVTDAEDGVSGAYQISLYSETSGIFFLAPNESLDFARIVTAGELDTEKISISANYECNKRLKFIQETRTNLILETPEESVNLAFAFAKLRAVESIYKTTGGLMHGPGGGRYYAAIWANDQAEYANPFFPFLGNIAGNESAINSFRHFARFMNEAFNPIPSSIIAEGDSYWNGAGDRGDMAMIAYGAARFALANGNPTTARELWPLITWCLEYCRQKLNEDGVVRSDSDELEGRFPAGKANLNTSCLYYDALISTVYLAEELGMDSMKISDFRNAAKKLRESIDSYFSAEVEGYNTYRYFEENEKLRAWICTPLTVGIFDRKEETQAALFSDKLWTVDGLASESGSTTFWDRATLYALRGVFASGETKKAFSFFLQYSKRRLLGEHVPYPVEAYPEGNQRHLSAESALYCRIITEGLFNIRPIGFHAFTMQPVLPAEWEFMRLRKIHAFDCVFDLEVSRTDSGFTINIIKQNASIQILEWTAETPVIIDLDAI